MMHQDSCLITLLIFLSCYKEIKVVGEFNVISSRADNLIPHEVSKLNVSTSDLKVPILDYFINGTTLISGFPDPPFCSYRGKETRSTELPLTVTIWKLNEGESSMRGIYMWAEEIETECYSGLLGKREWSTLGTRPAPADRSDFPKIKTSDWNNQTSVMTRVDNNQRYDCWWLSTTKKVVQNYWWGVVVVSYGPDGSILSPSGRWKLISGTRTEYESNGHYLSLHKEIDLRDCSFMIRDVAPGVISAVGQDAIITVPSRHWQFVVEQYRGPSLCEKNNTKIYKTSGGYLISYRMFLHGSNHNQDSLKEMSASALESQLLFEGSLLRKEIDKHTYNSSERDKTQMRESKVSPSINDALRETYDYSLWRYEMKEVIDQINSYFQSIHYKFCEMMQIKWQDLMQPDLPTKVARYLTGDFKAIGWIEGGKYHAVPSLKFGKLCDIKLPIRNVKGMLSVSCELLEDVWVEPISGRIYLEPRLTIFSLHSTKFPLKEGGYWDSSSGYVIKETDIGDNYIHVVEGSASHYVKIYSQGEAFQQNALMKFKYSTTDDISPWSWDMRADYFSSWMPLFHLGSVILMGLVVLVLVRCCLSAVKDASSSYKAMFKQ